MGNPLVGHLRDLVENSPEASFILAGGLGLMLKRRYLERNDVQTLARSADHPHPGARATIDIDLFLKIELFIHPARGVQLREALGVLEYDVLYPNWAFSKPLNDEQPNVLVKVDLMARHPIESEPVRVDALRVGGGSGAKVHGRQTVEAFAVELEPQIIDILDDDGSQQGRVLTAHPYAWLNMKVRAAHDWLRFQSEPWELRENEQPPNAKHVFDATLIVAMVTESELNTCRRLAAEHRTHPEAQVIRDEATELFGSTTAFGWRTAVANGMFDDHSLIWPTMKEMLGI